MSIASMHTRHQDVLLRISIAAKLVRIKGKQQIAVEVSARHRPSTLKPWMPVVPVSGQGSRTYVTSRRITYGIRFMDSSRGDAAALLRGAGRGRKQTGPRPGGGGLEVFLYRPPLGAILTVRSDTYGPDSAGDPLDLVVSFSLLGSERADVVGLGRCSGGALRRPRCSGTATFKTICFCGKTETTGRGAHSPPGRGRASLTAASRTLGRGIVGTAQAALRLEPAG